MRKADSQRVRHVRAFLTIAGGCRCVEEVPAEASALSSCDAIGYPICTSPCTTDCSLCVHSASSLSSFSASFTPVSAAPCLSVFLTACLQAYPPVCLRVRLLDLPVQLSLCPCTCKYAIWYMHALHRHDYDRYSQSTATTTCVCNLRKGGSTGGGQGGGARETD